MSWKHYTEDGLVDVVIDPDFNEDLLALAHFRPVWIIDSKNNRPRIDRAWQEGHLLGLFEISRCKPVDQDAERSFWSVISELDEHYGPYRGIIVHGLAAGESFARSLAENGFYVKERSSFGFTADMDPQVRGSLLGRRYVADSTPWGRPA